MSINLSDIIINCDNQYNGHNQLSISGLSFNIEDIFELCEEIRIKLHEQKGFLGSVYYEVHPDGGGTIIAGDYFKDHPLGHKDKALININLKIN